MQCRTEQCNTVQYNTVQYNTIQYNTIYWSVEYHDKIIISLKNTNVMKRCKSYNTLQSNAID
jgi:hypothetical protein